MKSLELNSTHENIFETLTRGQIGRTDDVFRFVQFLNEIEGGFSVALDGRWGSGKTFFVKQTKMVLDTYNEFATNELGSDERAAINQCAGNSIVFRNKDYQIAPQVTVYYDAWANDNAEDPILSIVYDIAQSLNATYSIADPPKVFNGAAKVFEAVKGWNPAALIDAFQSRDPLKVIENKKSLQMAINDFIDSVIDEHGERLVIFVDELDRCKPDYAVRLLERIKHYFTNDRITFVFSINSFALQHTIRKYYGEEFDASRYTDRFFDITMGLPKINTDHFLNSVGIHQTSLVFDIVRRQIVKMYHFEMREILRYYMITSVAAQKPNRERSFHHYGNFFALVFAIPVAIALKMSDLERYERFVNGLDSTPFVEVLEHAEWEHQQHLLLFSDEAYESDREQDKKIVKLKEKLEEAYNALFVYDYNQMRPHGISIGQAWFDEDSRNDFFRVLSAISADADYGK